MIRLVKLILLMLALLLIAEGLVRLFTSDDREDIVYKARECELLETEGGTTFGCSGPQSMRSIQVTAHSNPTSTGDQLQSQGQLLKIAPPGQKPRLIFLGGSSVCEPPAGNFPTHIARLRPDWEVLNLCKSGMSINNVATLVEQSQLLNPSLIVVYAAHNQYNSTIMARDLPLDSMWQRALVSLLRSSQIYKTLFKMWWNSEMANESRVVFRPVRGRPNALQVTNSTTALDARASIDERFEESYGRMLRESKAPVLVTSVLHNADVSPQGILTSNQDCINASRNIRSKPFATQLQQLQHSCGEEHAMVDWLKMKVAAQAGRWEQAEQHWRRSLERDPLPLRAPMSVNDTIARLAAESGTPFLDLYQHFGPLPAGLLFVDTLHFSQAGVEQLSAVLIPEIEKELNK